MVLSKALDNRKKRRGCVKRPDKENDIAPLNRKKQHLTLYLYGHGSAVMLMGVGTVARVSLVGALGSFSLKGGPRAMSSLSMMLRRAMARALG